MNDIDSADESQLYDIKVFMHDGNELFSWVIDFGFGTHEGKRSLHLPTRSPVANGISTD